MKRNRANPKRRKQICGTQYEEGGETHVMLEEIGEVVVEEENKDESDCCNEDDEDDGVFETTFELNGGGIRGILEVYEVGGGTDLRVGGYRERVGEKDDEEHADGDRSHHADYLNSKRIEDTTRLHSLSTFCGIFGYTIFGPEEGDDEEKKKKKKNRDERIRIKLLSLLLDGSYHLSHFIYFFPS